MTHGQLVKSIKPGGNIKIKGNVYRVKQHIVWMQHRADCPYNKWVLADNEGYDGYRLFIEESEPAMGFGKTFHYKFEEPMPDKLKYKGKKYKKICEEFCTVIKVEGEEVYKKGDGEIWWDYVSEDNDKEGLSLGRN